MAFCEVKGTTRGVKREYINQVDSHRERSGDSQDTPGMLLINTGMQREGIEERISIEIGGEHSVHAAGMNIIIIRTIDLLFLMRHIEKEQNRGEILLELIKSGGGWLKADEKGYKLIRG